jgi:HD-GYP domain-containing protein (c-di-GMP phosphodiesterase class II)
MRYLPIVEIKEGMALGQDIYDGEGRMLLTKHQILNSEYIVNLETMGYPGVYIDDDFSEDIEIEEVIKPVIKSCALKIVHTLFMEDENAEDAQEWKIRKLVTDVVEDILNNGDVMYNMMDLKNYDDYTFFHSVNVSVLSAILGARYGMDEYELRILTTAALLHDIGKKFLEVDILNAKRPLIEDERRILLQHPKLGYEFLRDNYDFAPEVCGGVLQHHESYNGEGYPLRKSGNDISINGRIIKLADVFDAMTSRRPYRTALTPSDAVEYVMAMCGSEFDPQLVEIFLKWIAIYPVGCEVVLSDGRKAVVAKNFPNFVLRPVVKVIGTGELLNLNEDRKTLNITIIRMVI